MKKSEVSEIINIIKSVYPNFTRGEEEVVRMRIQVWARQLIEWDYAKTKDNLMKHIESSPYIPSIAEIKPRVQRTYSMKQQLEKIYGDADD